MEEKVKHFIEDTFLIILIILNLLDFFHLLPGDLDYIKKIISWTLVAYLCYKFNFPRILFGQSSVRINFFIIISYIFLAFKKFTSSMPALSEEATIFKI